MVSMHLSEEHLSQLSCKEECGSIPDPELYRCSLVMASSQQQLIRAPRWPSVCCLVAFQKRQHSCLSLQIPPKQQAGICVVSATCQTNACCLSDPIPIKMPRKRCFFILLLTLSSVMVPLQPSSSSFFFFTFVTHSDNKITCPLSWKALSPTETSQELSCQDSKFRCWIHGDVC